MYSTMPCCANFCEVRFTWSSKLSMLPRGPMPIAPVTETIETPAPIHTRLLRPGIPARCCPRLSIDASVLSRRSRRACAFISISTSSWWRAKSAIMASICGSPLNMSTNCSASMTERSNSVSPCSGMVSTDFSIRARSESASSVKSCRTRTRAPMWNTATRVCGASALRYRVTMARTRMLYCGGVLSSSSTSAVMLRGGPGVNSTRLVKTPAGSGMAFGSTGGPPSYLKNAIGRDLPFSLMVKSSSRRSVTAFPFLSSAVTVSSTSRVLVRNVGACCCADRRTRNTANVTAAVMGLLYH